ncbi:hypothetical protein ACU686_19680 [Yinghuangia aomiensis]
MAETAELGARYLDAAIALLEGLRDRELPAVDEAADRTPGRSRPAAGCSCSAAATPR